MKQGTLVAGFVAAIGLTMLLGSATIEGQSGDPTYVSPPVSPYVVDVDLRTLPVTSASTATHSQLTAPDTAVAPHALHAPDALRSTNLLHGLGVTPPEF